MKVQEATIYFQELIRTGTTSGNHEQLLKYLLHWGAVIADATTDHFDASRMLTEMEINFSDKNVLENASIPSWLSFHYYFYLFPQCFRYIVMYIDTYYSSIFGFSGKIERNKIITNKSTREDIMLITGLCKVLSNTGYGKSFIVDINLHKDFMGEVSVPRFWITFDWRKDGADRGWEHRFENTYGLPRFERYLRIAHFSIDEWIKFIHNTERRIVANIAASDITITAIKPIFEVEIRNHIDMRCDTLLSFNIFRRCKISHLASYHIDCMEMLRVLVNESFSNNRLYDVRRFKTDYLNQLLQKCAIDSPLAQKVINAADESIEKCYEMDKLNFYYNFYYVLDENDSTYANKKTFAAEKMIEILESNSSYLDYTNITKFIFVIHEEFPGRTIRCNNRYISSLVVNTKLFTYYAPNFEKVNMNNIQELINIVISRVRNPTNDYGNMAATMTDQLYIIANKFGHKVLIKNTASFDPIITWIANDIILRKNEFADMKWNK